MRLVLQPNGYHRQSEARGIDPDGLARALAGGLATRLGQQFVIKRRWRRGDRHRAGRTRPPDGYHGSVRRGLCALRAARAPFRRKSPTRPMHWHRYVQPSPTRWCWWCGPTRRSSRWASLSVQRAPIRASSTTSIRGRAQSPIHNEEFLQVARLNLNNVPYRGDPAVLTDLFGGNVDFGALVGGTVIGQNVRVLGIFARRRNPALPNAPTVREQGFDVAPVSFGGLLAPGSDPVRTSIGKLDTACVAASEGRSLPDGVGTRRAALERLRHSRGVCRTPEGHSRLEAAADRAHGGAEISRKRRRDLEGCRELAANPAGRSPR